MLIVDILGVCLRAQINLMDIRGERPRTIDTGQRCNIHNTTRVTLFKESLGSLLSRLEDTSPAPRMVDLLIDILVIKIDHLWIHVGIKPSTYIIKRWLLYTLMTLHDQLDTALDHTECLQAKEIEFNPAELFQVLIMHPFDPWGLHLSLGHDNRHALFNVFRNNNPTRMSAETLILLEQDLNWFSYLWVFLNKLPEDLTMLDRILV